MNLFLLNLANARRGRQGSGATRVEAHAEELSGQRDRSNPPRRPQQKLNLSQKY